MVIISHKKIVQSKILLTRTESTETSTSTETVHNFYGMSIIIIN